MPTIAILGERDPAKAPHQGIEASFAQFQRQTGTPLDYRWVRTNALTEANLGSAFSRAAGLWAAPGNYENSPGALGAMRHFRTSGLPFLGTCGGFQHALMEFAANVLKAPAASQELNPEAANPLIIRLSCPLVGGATGRIIAAPSSDFAELLGGPESIEAFHCNYGMNSDLRAQFEGSDMAFVAQDEAGEIRAFRHRRHPFYVGTLFQPERRALTGTLHPLVQAFFRSVH